MCGNAEVKNFIGSKLLLVWLLSLTDYNLECCTEVEFVITGTTVASKYTILSQDKFLRKSHDLQGVLLLARFHVHTWNHVASQYVGQSVS